MLLLAFIIEIAIFVYIYKGKNNAIKYYHKLYLYFKVTFVMQYRCTSVDTEASNFV